MKKTFFSLVLLVSVTLAFGQTVPRQMVALEIGTGTWCQYCPGAAMGADDLLENGKLVGVVENHNGDSYANNYSNARNNFYSINSFPTAKFDGVLSVEGGSHTQSMYGSYLPKYNNRIQEPSDVNIYMDITNNNLDYTATITLVKTAEWAATTPKLQFCVTQSNIQQNWQGQTHLEHVNRLMVPDANGTTVEFTGDTMVTTLNFSLDAAWPVEDVEFVVFVQDNTGKEIHQCIKRAAIDLSADFVASANTINLNDTVHFTSSVTGGYIGVPQSYEWLTPGAIPSYSTDTNLTARYTHCGPHDVTLIVNRGGQMDTIVKTMLIQVGPVVNVTSNPGDTTCWYEPITLDATTATATSYLWSTGDTTASITVAGNTYGTGAHTFDVTITTSDGCEQTISHDIYFETCTGIDNPANHFTAAVYPNPNNGYFTVVMNGQNSLRSDLRIFDMVGKLVYEETGLVINGKETRTLDLNLSRGLYYLVLQNADGKTVTKFSVTK